MKLKFQLKDFIAKSSCKIGQEIAQSNLKEIERDLKEETARENAEKVKEYLNSVETLEGNFSSSCDPTMAKHDKEGNLVTAPGALKKLYLENYIETG